MGQDIIKISNLEVFAYHGVLKEENSLGQKFIICAELSTDISEAAKDDDITKSINYASVCKTIEKYLKENTFKLIETTADKLATYLLRKYERLDYIRLEIKKPWAPIHMSLETVSVQVDRGWHKVYLSIGSNLGDKEANLTEAIKLLNEDEDCEVTRVSTFLTTEPVGGVEQDDFLNGAILIKTLKTPSELLMLIGRIEKELKRERIVHWGPRTIDLDILFYDQDIVQTKELTIPHKEIANRLFVLDPMCEIAPWYRHPVLGETMLQLRNKLSE